MATTLPSDIPFGKYLLGSPWGQDQPGGNQWLFGSAVGGPRWPGMSPRTV